MTDTTILIWLDRACAVTAIGGFVLAIVMGWPQ